MSFWDSSALVPLVVEEPSTPVMQALAESDPQILVWGWTRVEIAGAVERRVREGSVDRSARRRALGQLDELAARWDEVVDLSGVRRRALPLLARHPIRAADAAQVGAALLVAEYIAPLVFVSLDETLARVAELEGLDVPLSPES